MNASKISGQSAGDSLERTDRLYVFIPLPLAAAIGLEAWEEFQWSLTDRNTLAVLRLAPPAKVTRNAKSAKAAKK